MWRVTNVRQSEHLLTCMHAMRLTCLGIKGNDVVATGLPDAGDNLEWALGPYNMFACTSKYPVPSPVSLSFPVSRAPWL